MKEQANIAIATSSKSFFVTHALRLCNYLRAKGYNAELFNKHEDIPDKYNIVFYLSYFRIVEKEYLNKREHNLVVHESALPKGRGWAPLFWQILEGWNTISICLMEAGEDVDNGDIYLRDFIELEGHELHDEIRVKQAEKTIELCLSFLRTPYSAIKQEGTPTYYKRRTPADSELDVDKTIREQFLNLRVASNEDYPAFFMLNGREYVLEIREVKS